MRSSILWTYIYINESFFRLLLYCIPPQTSFIKTRKCSEHIKSVSFFWQIWLYSKQNTIFELHNCYGYAYLFTLHIVHCTVTCHPLIYKWHVLVQWLFDISVVYWCGIMHLFSSSTSSLLLLLIFLNLFPYICKFYRMRWHSQLVTLGPGLLHGFAKVLPRVYTHRCKNNLNPLAGCLS